MHGSGPIMHGMASLSLMPGGLRFAGVAAERLVGLEEQVALDRKTELAAHRLDLREADVAQLRAAEAEVTKAEGEVRVLRIEFCQKPGRAGVGREELHDRIRIDLLAGSRAGAVREKLGAQMIWDELHGGLRDGPAESLSLSPPARRGGSRRPLTLWREPLALLRPRPKCEDGS